MEEGPWGFQGCATQLALGGEGPLGLSRGHRVPASVCSQSGKHGVELGGAVGGFRLGDKGRAVGPPSWPGTLGSSSQASGAALLAAPSPLLGGPGEWVGGQLRAAAAPPAPGGTATSSPWDPQPLLSRTPATRLDLHVHRANVARLVLSDPQLPVLGGVHLSEQLVHRLDCLQGREKGEAVRGSGRARDTSSEPRCSPPGVPAGVAPQGNPGRGTDGGAGRTGAWSSLPCSAALGHVALQTRGADEQAGGLKGSGSVTASSLPPTSAT